MFVRNAKSLLTQFVLLFSFLTSFSQVNYRKEMLDLDATIRQHFYMDSIGYYKESLVPEKDSRAVSFLWPLCALMQADNEMERVIPSAKKIVPDFTVIEKYHDLRPPAPGYASYSIRHGGGDRFYDDNQWIGIAAMDAFNRTQDKHWLEVGKEIYRFMMTAYDSAAGGGLYWQEGNKRTKNTCSNGPGIILALQLYQATKEQSYLDTALVLYNWVNEHLRSPEGLYYDNINLVKKTVDQKLYSYNTGTMMQSAVYLYECTKDKKYLDAAITTAENAVPVFLATDKFNDAYWFHAVLLRGYQHLLKHHPDKKYITAFKAAVDKALQNNSDANGLMGKVHTVNLVGQGGMLEILARLAWIQEQHQQ